MPDPDTAAGDAESSGGLWPAIRKLFDSDQGDRSLRAQLEEAIDEHEGENSGTPETMESRKGDLSPVERQMLRNLLHFSEHDADDVSIPRGEIIAVEASASWDELVNTFAEHDSLLDPIRQLQPSIGFLTNHPTEGEFPFFEGSCKTAASLGLKAATPAHYGCFVTRDYDPREWASHLSDDTEPLIIAYNQSVIYAPS